MAQVRVSVTIPRPRDVVWSHLRDIASHVDWMADAKAIRFTTEAREGIGTGFECDTRIGPLRLVDHMLVTEWVEGEVIGVHHTGVVAGTGRFELDDTLDGGVRLSWAEDLTFPWGLAGRIGAVAAAPVLRAVWAGNLRRFRRIVEGAPAPRR